MDKFYPPNFQGYIPLPNGKPAAGGTLIACRTGTDVLAPIYNEDGTLIVGSAAPIDSSGCVHCLLDPTITYRIKIVPPAGEGPWPTMVFDNVRVAECNITGMLNPMTAQYDLIVGGANGAPERLPPSYTMGQVLAVQNALGLVGWTDLSYLLPELADIGKVRVAQNAPLKFAGDAIIIAVGLKGNTDNVNGTITISIDADGITAGYILTANGSDGVSWAPPAVQSGDHKVLADEFDTHAGNLKEKIVADSPLRRGFDNISDGEGGTISTMHIDINSDTASNGDVLTADGNGNSGWSAPVGFANPMTTLGDLIVGGVSGVASRLGVGTDGQVLTSLSGSVGWAAPVGFANPMDGYGQMITGGAGGAAMKLAQPTSILHVLGATDPGFGFGCVPQWQSAWAILVKGLANIGFGFTKGDLLYGGDPLTAAGDLTGMTELCRLGIGTDGYVLKSRSGVPVWEAESGGGGGGATCQENFSLLNCDNYYDTSSKTNTIYATKVVSNATGTRSKLGFFHKSGTTGYVLLGVYDNSGALLAQTAKTSPDNSTLEQMCWINTTSNFTMTAGEEYWFVAIFLEDNWQCNINLMGKTIPTAIDVNLVGSKYVGAINALPNTLSGLTGELVLFYEGAM